MTGVILYQSKYGATKRYADWISKDTGFSCVETTKADIYEIVNFDVIILGGGIYASGIAGLSFLKKHLKQLCDKKIIVFCVGASPYDPITFQQVVDHNMTGVLAKIPCFYCRGAWNMDAMGFVDRNLCKLLQKAVQKKDYKNCAVWEKALLEAGNQKLDWTDKTYIVPIIREIDEQM